MAEDEDIELRFRIKKLNLMQLVGEFRIAVDRLKDNKIIEEKEHIEYMKYLNDWEVMLYGDRVRRSFPE